MRHFLLRWELPAVFATSCAGTVLALTNGHPLAAVWLLAAAAWCALLWWLLLPWQATRHPQQKHQRQYHTGYRQPRRAASRR